MSNRGDGDAFDDPDFDDPDVDDADDIDPEKLVVCAYWRCGDLFEARSANHRYCRKACRSRQNKWARAQERRRAKAARRESRKR